MTKKINTFSFKCGECDHAFDDAAFAPTLESECPECGEWNYSESPNSKKESHKIKLKKIPEKG